MTLPRLAFLVLAGLALYVAADGRASETAASAPQTATAAFSAPETSTRPLASSGLDQAPVGGGGAFRAGLADSASARPLSKASLGLGVQVAPRAGTGDNPPVVGSGSPSCESPCYVSVEEWDQPTPEPLWTFNGLHPIAESWNVGVASGKASHVGAGFPSWYLALPIGPGFRVRIVGPGGEVTRVSTDAGPALHLQRPPDNRIADLSVSDFVHVCGVPAAMGLCQVSVAILGRTK